MTTSSDDRAMEMLGMLDRLRKNFPESKEWTQGAYDAVRYITLGTKASWVREYLALDKKRT